MKKGIIFFKPHHVHELNEEHLANCFDHNASQKSAVWWKDRGPINTTDLTGKTKAAVLEFAQEHKEDTLIIVYQDRYPILNAGMPYIDRKNKKYLYYFHAGELDISHTTENEDLKYFNTLIAPLSLHGKISMLNFLGENEKNGEFLIIHNVDKFQISRLGKGWKESGGCYFSNDFFSQKKWPHYQAHQTTHYPVKPRENINTRKESEDDDETIHLVDLQLKVVKPQLRLYFKLPAHVQYYITATANPRLQVLDFVDSIAGSKDMSKAQIAVINARKKEAFNPLHISVLRFDQIAWSDPEKRTEENVKAIKTKLKAEYITSLTERQRFFIATQLAKAISDSDEAIARNKSIVSSLNDRDLIVKSAFLDLDWEKIEA